MYVEYVTIKENVGLDEEVEFDVCGIKLKTVAPNIDEYLRAFDCGKLKELIKAHKVVEQTKFDLVIRAGSDSSGTSFSLYWRESEHYDRTDGPYNIWSVKLNDA